MALRELKWLNRNSRTAFMSPIELWDRPERATRKAAKPDDHLCVGRSVADRLTAYLPRRTELLIEP
ncbi:MAG: hypothetical protein JWN70_3617 [Planctomycetaceae bacterium]|nr:hypothetical protein [Planctomycetaceae bacterium]